MSVSSGVPTSVLEQLQRIVPDLRDRSIEVELLGSWVQASMAVARQARRRHARRGKR